jgi:hypothetical protein
LLPFPAVSHGLGEGLSLLLVVVAHGAVAGGQVLVPGGAVVVVGLTRGSGFGVGADGAEGGEGLVPGGPLVWRLVAGFGSDRVAGMVVAVNFAVRRDGGGLAFPVAAGGWVGGDRVSSTELHRDRLTRRWIDLC